MAHHLLEYKWKYNGPIFDAHTHVWNRSNFVQVVEEQIELGVERLLVIAHLKEVRDYAAQQFPDRFVFAKYLSTQNIVSYNVESVVREIKVMRSEGYSLAKMWVAPAWRRYTQNMIESFMLTSPRLSPIFLTLESEKIPLLIHVADPDTYYATTYSNAEIHGTKDEHLAQLETLIQEYSKLTFQLAHFGSQPEIPRLGHLGVWFDKYPNIVVDTASSRWMVRELGRNPAKARRFLLKYSNRVLFGTDGQLNSSFRHRTESPNNGARPSPYNLRLNAQRLLWETKARKIPLPFPDPDTEASGGTFINGLNLPKAILRNIYWKNAQKLYRS